MQIDNPFWRFSLRVYVAPEVAEECLAVQERYGIDVNVLLFCAWVAIERCIVLTPADIEACEQAIAEWHERAVRPLRVARRAMKRLAGAEKIRIEVKALELEAERLEQNLLFTFATARWPRTGEVPRKKALRANLDYFLHLHGPMGANAVPALVAAADFIGNDGAQCL